MGGRSDGEGQGHQLPAHLQLPLRFGGGDTKQDTVTGHDPGHQLLLCSGGTIGLNL